jgi:hypothetical protein
VTLASTRRAARYALARGRQGEPVLTVRQPWASAIFNAGKDIENRVWPTNYRGRLWIHAGLATTRAAPDRWADEHGLWVPPEPLPRGAIIGSVDLAEIVRNSPSPWALPRHYHWVLRQPMLLVRPVKWKGSLGLTFIRPPQGAIRSARRSRRSYG